MYHINLLSGTRVISFLIKVFCLNNCCVLRISVSTPISLSLTAILRGNHLSFLDQNIVFLSHLYL